MPTSGFSSYRKTFYAIQGVKDIARGLARTAQVASPRLRLQSEENKVRSPESIDPVWHRPTPRLPVSSNDGLEDRGYVGFRCIGSDRSNTIATGVVRGVPVPAKHRRYVLQVRLILNAGTLIVVEGVLAIGWLLVGGNASADDLKLLAYLVAFINAVGAIGWLVTLPTHYRHLGAVLREAESDWSTAG